MRKYTISSRYYPHFVTGIIAKGTNLGFDNVQKLSIVMSGADPKIKPFLIMGGPESVKELLMLPIARSGELK